MLKRETQKRVIVLTLLVILCSILVVKYLSAQDPSVTRSPPLSPAADPNAPPTGDPNTPPATDSTKPEATDKSYYNSAKDWVKKQIPENTGLRIKQIFGFEGFSTLDVGFWGGFFLGCLVGLWVFVSTFYKKLHNKILEMLGKKEKWSTKTNWLDVIGGSVWKIPVVGIGLGIIYSIPIINRFFQLITFEAIGLGIWARSLLIAFYIGFGPAWIESFIKYRMRLKYEQQVLAARAGVQVSKAMAGG